MRGLSWSIDGIYRETRSRVSRRVEKGCLVVEMEASALMAIARYRSIPFGEVVMAGDSLAGLVVGAPRVDDGQVGAPTDFLIGRERRGPADGMTTRPAQLFSFDDTAARDRWRYDERAGRKR